MRLTGEEQAIELLPGKASTVHGFWRRLGRRLPIFATPDRTLSYRLPNALSAESPVGADGPAQQVDAGGHRRQP